MRGLLILSLLIGVNVCYAAYEDYDEFEVMEIGVERAMDGGTVYTEHYLNEVYYIINLGTPGFIRPALYNILRRDKRVDNEGYYQFYPGIPDGTNRDLDFYIEAQGRGFFVIKMPNNTHAYTRDGRFRVDYRNRLVTLSGNYPVFGEGGVIYVDPNKDFTSSRSGVLYNGGEAVDRLKIVVFESIKEMALKLESIDGSFFIAKEELGVLSGFEHYAVLQGFIDYQNPQRSYNYDFSTVKHAYTAAYKTAFLISNAIKTSGSISSPQ
jgi:hypothetical protein